MGEMGSRTEVEQLSSEYKGHLMLEVTGKETRMNVVVKTGAREGESGGVCRRSYSMAHIC